MPSALKKTLLIFLFLLLIPAGLLVVLVSTEGGTQLLAEQARTLAGDAVEWGDLQGSLLGPLTLREVKVRQPGLAADIASLELDWQPERLSGRLLKIAYLNASGIRIELSETDTDASSETPLLPGNIDIPLDISLGALALRDIELVLADGSIQQIEEVRMGLELQDRHIALEQLEARLPGVRVSADGEIGLENLMPVELSVEGEWLPPEYIDSDGTLVTPPAISGALQLAGQLDWNTALGFDLTYQVSGTPLDRLMAELPPVMTAKGRIEGNLQEEVLFVAGATLALEESPVVIEVAGTLGFPATGSPDFDGQLGWAGIQWPLTGESPIVSSSTGQLVFIGHPEQYKVELALSLQGEQIPPGDWRGEGHGGATALQLEQLHGKVLDGEIDIHGSLSWDPIPRWALAVEAGDVVTDTLLPELPGRLSASARSRGTLDQDRIEAELTLESLSGQLAGYPLTSSVDATLDGEEVTLSRLHLESAGNVVHASGSVSPEHVALDWHVQATNPEGLLPGAAGIVSAEGTVGGSPESPRVSAKLSGDKLQFDSLTAERLRADLQIGIQADDVLAVDLTIGAVSDGDQMLLNAASVQAKGTTSTHQLDLELHGATEQLTARLQGGLDSALSAWSGNLMNLAATTNDYGNWQLTQKTSLSVTVEELMLGEACLREAIDGTRVCARGTWSQSDGGILAANLRGLPVDRLQQNVSAQLNGDLAASLANDGQLGARASFTMTPGSVRVDLDQGIKTLTHGGGNAELTIGTQGMEAEIRFEAPERGLVSANVQLPDLTHFPMAEPQTLAGRVRATLPDLSILPAWIPELDASAGRLEADLQLAGTVEKPWIAGDLALLDGAAYISAAGLKLRDIELLAQGDPGKPGPLVLSGGLASGPGRVDLEGTFNIDQNRLSMKLRGDRLEVYNTQDVRALLSPDLDIGWSDQTLMLRGTLLIPEADITPKLALGPGALSESSNAAEPPQPGQYIGPSPDVVILGAEGSPLEQQFVEAPFLLDNKVQLVLGERVNVNALGFISRITGAVTFTNAPSQRDLIPMADGRLSVEDGTFRAFGQDLDIETGQLIFANVPVTEPELNVRAVRWIDNDPVVSAAGVLVTGPATEPNLELFSRPQMDTSEIQSYLLTGQSAGNRDSALSIGTYLHPKIYVGYGYNMLEKTSEFNSIYTITPRYGVGVTVGEADNNVNLTFTHER